VAASTVEFSGGRLRNAADHPEAIRVTLPARRYAGAHGVVVTRMKRWLALAGAMAVVPLAACSSSSPQVPSPQVPSPLVPRSTAPGGPHTATPGGPHTATLAAGGRPDATLDVLTGTAALKIGTADFGAGAALLKVSTPAGDPPPHLRETDPGAGQPGQGTVIGLSAPGASAVTVTLNAAVRWRLVLGGGTTRTTADLRGTEVTGIAFTAGSDVISLALPRPRGHVPVQLAGGASQFLLSLPGGVPARVTAEGGAGEVSLEGQDHVGVAGGSVFTTRDWTGGAPGFDIDATAGAARVAVTARGR
jgi:hypothetical protein